MYAIFKRQYFVTFYHQNKKQLSSLKTNEDNILSIMKSLDSNKSHDWDKLSIKMMKMCVMKLQTRANVVPVHKKEGKNLLKNNWSINILPIFGKIYQKIIFKELCNHYHPNELFIQDVSLVFSPVIQVFCSYCLLSTK